MAGGRFDINVGKIRPGTYINFEAQRQDSVNASERGVVILPLGPVDYGPAGEIIHLTADAPDSAMDKLGYSIADNDSNKNMLRIREAFKGAREVIVYICTEGATAATATGGGLKGTAKYKGTRGNSLSYSVVANPVSGFDITVFLAGEAMEKFVGVSTVAELAESKYIIFESSSGSTPISAVAGVTLANGTNTPLSNNGVTAFLDASESVAWNTMAFPFADSSLEASLISKIKHLRENVGKTVQAVASNCVADYEGIINVTNGYKLSDGTTVSAADATAYVAGITAGTAGNQSNTNRTVEGAASVVEPKTHSEAETAIENGEFFFSASEAGNVVVEYDINSLTSFTGTKNSTYRKNKIIRIFDELAEAIKANFPPNRFDNNETGWEVMEGIGGTLLKSFGPRSEGGSGEIANIDYEKDFKVDRERSGGDQTYFNVAIQPVDAAEKLYFTIVTR